MASLKDILVEHAKVPGSLLGGTPLAAVGSSISGIMGSVANNVPAPAGLPSLPLVPAPTLPTMPALGALGLGKGPFAGLGMGGVRGAQVSRSLGATSLSPAGVTTLAPLSDAIVQPAGMQGGRGSL